MIGFKQIAGAIKGLGEMEAPRFAKFAERQGVKLAESLPPPRGGLPRPRGWGAPVGEAVSNRVPTRAFFADMPQPNVSRSMRLPTPSSAAMPGPTRFGPPLRRPLAPPRAGAAITGGLPGPRRLGGLPSGARSNAPGWRTPSRLMAPPTRLSAAPTTAAVAAPIHPGGMLPRPVGKRAGFLRRPGKASRVISNPSILKNTRMAQGGKDWGNRMLSSSVSTARTLHRIGTKKGVGPAAFIGLGALSFAGGINQDGQVSKPLMELTTGSPDFTRYALGSPIGDAYRAKNRVSKGNQLQATRGSKTVQVGGQTVFGMYNSRMG